MINYIKVFDNFLESVGKHNGIVYGGYVNEIIIPTLKDSSFYGISKKINLYFQMENDSIKFINQCDKLYKINDALYEYYDNGALIITIVIVTDKPPFELLYCNNAHIYKNNQYNYINYSTLNAV